MPLQFDNRISSMDIFSLLGMVIVGAMVIFGLQGDLQKTQTVVDRNTRDIEIVRTDIGTVQARAERNLDELAEALERNRLEQKSDNLRLEAKLDKLIQRTAEDRP
jgi:hypothetical protein